MFKRFVLLPLYLSGVLSDRSGHNRPWIVAGYGMAGLARPLIAVAGRWLIVLLLRFGDRVGKGLRSSPRDALLALQMPVRQIIAWSLFPGLVCTAGQPAPGCRGPGRCG